MRRLISDEVRLEIYKMYTEDDMRAQEIADKYGCTLQHVLKIIRIVEGKSIWRKPRTSAIFYNNEAHGQRLFHYPKGYRNEMEDVK